MNRKRKPLTKKHIKSVFDRIKKQLSAKIAKRGMGRYDSVHEIYGIVAEEAYELLKATHENNNQEFVDELLDIAIGCLWGIASFQSLKEDGVYK